ncbi:YciI family protein [Bacteroides fragilis]|nr:YciI family protein [Bacteroides fragilis]
MFVLILTYKAPIEKVIELLEAHCCYWISIMLPESFLLPGPQVPRTGGVILCRAQSRAEVEKIIGEDPFNAVADYRVIEFEPNKSVEGFKELLKIG